MSAPWPKLPVRYDAVNALIWDAQGIEVLDLERAHVPFEHTDEFGERLAAFINQPPAPQPCEGCKEKDGALAKLLARLDVRFAGGSVYGEHVSTETYLRSGPETKEAIQEARAVLAAGRKGT